MPLKRVHRLPCTSLVRSLRVRNLFDPGVDGAFGKAKFGWPHRNDKYHHSSPNNTLIERNELRIAMLFVLGGLW